MKQFFSILIFMFFVCSKLNAQEILQIDTSYSKKESFKEKKKIPNFQNVLKTGVSSWLIGNMGINGEFRLVYERMLANQHSIIVGASYNYKSPIFALLDAMSDSISIPVNINGYRVQGAYRFYPIKKLKAPNGLYVGPHFSYQSLFLTDKHSKDYIELSNFFAVAASGYQIVTKKRVSIDFNVGIGYQKTWYKEVLYNGNQPQTIKYPNNLNKIPVKIMTQINIGYAF